MNRREFLNGRVEVVRGDLLAVDADAVVSSAHRSLIDGDKVTRAIQRAAGPEFVTACRSLGSCEPGQAVMTPGYNLRARHVIHTVGPVWNGGRSGEDDVLRSCYRSILQLARQARARTVAIPPIATGAFRFPLDRAAAIAAHTVHEQLAADLQGTRVVFCCAGAGDFGTFVRAVAAELSG